MTGNGIYIVSEKRSHPLNTYNYKEKILDNGKLGIYKLASNGAIAFFMGKTKLPAFCLVC
ncbi:MAG TPA: hypothetical protein V6D15_02490 [Oculatellaceae cyanobacterium]